MPADASCRKRWFTGGPGFDRELEQQFLPCFDNVDTLPQPVSIVEKLARIILLDQISRNIFRRTARAFAYDHLASQLSGSGVQDGVDRPLGIDQRAFFYMPLEHSESLDLQELSCRCFQSLVDDCQIDADRQTAQGYLDYALEHRDIIRRFGRFPHRNAVLEREPTREEEEYLNTGGSTYGQGR